MCKYEEHIEGLSDFKSEDCYRYTLSVEIPRLVITCMNYAGYMHRNENCFGVYFHPTPVFFSPE
jgi:hypothetical protein